MLTTDGSKSTGFNRSIGGKTCQDRDVHQRASDDFKPLLQEVEGTIGKKIILSSDLEKLARLLSNRGSSMMESASKGVWKHVSIKEKPSKVTLDVLASFAKFQSWDNSRQALYGESNGDLEGEDHSRRPRHG